MEPSENDELVNSVGDALYRVSVYEARQLVDGFNYQLDRMTAVFESAYKESDRSLAILVFALVEDLMVDAMKYYMKGSVKGGWSALTSANGLLATANDRITILELLAWIKPGTGHDIRLMKDIRNRFAHHSDVGDFSDIKIRGWLSSMSDSEKAVISALEGSEKARKFIRTPRNIFLVRSIITVVVLVADLSVLPAAIIHRVDAIDVHGHEFDDTNEDIKELRRIAARVILIACFVDSNA